MVRRQRNVAPQFLHAALGGSGAVGGAAVEQADFVVQLTATQHDDVMCPHEIGPCTDGRTASRSVDQMEFQ